MVVPVFPVQMERLVFDETTTNQRQKQMDLLLRFWDGNTNCIVSKYLGPPYFDRATAADLTSMLTDVMDSDDGIPWERLFYVSSDRPNINKSLWRNLNKNLKDKGYKGLLPLIVCTLHTMHNVLGKEQLLMVWEKWQSSWLSTYLPASRYIFVVL